MADDFRISTSVEADGTRVVAVHGDIDLFTAPEFKDAVTGAIAASAVRVVVDLTGATFMDSSSLGVLIGAHRRMERRGRSLVVACNQDAILKVLRITGLDGVFELVPSRPEPAATQPA